MELGVGFVHLTLAGTALRRKSVTCVEKPACVILPGLGNNSDDYVDLSEKLEARGHRTSVVPVRRYDWGRNAKGFGMRSYWAGKLEPRSVLTWYFDRIATTIQMLKDEAGDGNMEVNLIGHSAGGWLARVFLGECASAEDRKSIRSLITLGTPHLAPPPGSFDQTRGLLDYVNREYPHNHHEEVRYICVGGKALQGKKLGQGTFEEWIAYQSYLPLCGSGDVWGDGITPVGHALLEGSEQVIIEGAKHSPLSAKNGQGWYGSDGFIDQWIENL